MMKRKKKLFHLTLKKELKEAIDSLLEKDSMT